MPFKIDRLASVAKNLVDGFPPKHIRTLDDGFKNDYCISGAVQHSFVSIWFITTTIKAGFAK